MHKTNDMFIQSKGRDFNCDLTSYGSCHLNNIIGDDFCEPIFTYELIIGAYLDEYKEIKNA